VSALPAYWPQIAAELNPGNNPNYGIGANYNWTDLTKRLVSKSATARGKQFELDAVQPGTWAGTWHNPDGNLDPSNAAGIFAPLLPYYPWRIRAQYPPTANLLTPDQASAGDWSAIAPGALPSGPVPANLQMTWYGASTDATSAGVVISASATAWQGTRVYAITLLAGAGPANQTDPFVMSVPVRPGAAYSFSVYVRCTTASQSISVQPQIWWENTLFYLAQTNGATATLTGAASAGWTRLTVSGTAPANATTAQIAVALTSTLTATALLQSDGWQWEASTAPSAWGMPSPWYPMYSGQIERYPQKWEQAGSYGTVDPTAVDVFALLSQTKFTDLMSASLVSAVPGTLPDFVYSFGDPSGSSVFTDFTGQRAAAAWDGNPALTAGVTQTATSTAGLFAAAPSVTVVNLTPPTLPASAASAVSPAITVPANAAGVFGPSTTGSGWTRQIAFRCTVLPVSGGASAIWLVDGFASNNNFAYLVIDNTGAVTFTLTDANTSGTLTLGTLTTGGWHLAAVTVSASGTLVTGCLDGAVTTLTLAAAWTGAGNAYNDDTVGALSYIGANTQYGPYEGDLAWYTQWPTALSTTALVSLYNTWRFAGVGEGSGARYKRILALAGYRGFYAVDTGASLSLGPATDVANNDALTCLNNVVATENGQHFVDAAGTVTFYSRTRRFLTNTPLYVFGENYGSGELPYDDVKFDFDPTHLGNVVQVTQVATNQVTTAQDLASQRQYGIRTLTRNNQSTNQSDINDCANYLLARYKQPKQRIASLILNPGAVPALWQAALSMELGVRIRAMRRPPGAPPIQFDGFVESVAWQMDDQNNATVTIEASPADPMPYAAFTTLRSSLAFAIAAGLAAGTAVTLNALADAAVNPPAANIAVGQSLVIDPGLATAELVTVATVATTVLGAATFTVTLQAAPAYAHPVGAVLCEPFPGWQTQTLAAYEPIAVFDAAVFDASASVFDQVNVFDACAFSY
jgi:hypothetical protein